MASRPSRDEVLLEMAYSMAKRSTCSRKSVGVLIARDGRVLSSGYNGAPSGLPHCNHECTCSPNELRESGSLKIIQLVHDVECEIHNPCRVATHAEANAIAYAARYGVGVEGATIYSTVLPCLACAQLIVNAGLVKVVYGSDYRDHAGLNLLIDAGIVMVG